MEQMKKVYYNLYNPTLKTRTLCHLIGAGLGYAASYLFYSNLVISGLVAVICAVVTYPLYKSKYIERRRTKLLTEFRDLLGSLSSSLGAGENVRNAFKSAEEDMLLRHGKESLIWAEVKLINVGLEVNCNIEDLLMDFGERSGLDDIDSFACVFETCYRRGGNIREVVNSTSRILCDKIDIQQEIRVLISGKKSEQNVMLVMPTVFTAILKWSGAGIVDLNSAAGFGSTTVALALFAIAYLISKRILNISI